MTRPSTYTEDLADRICERIADGESLRTICAGDDMPDRRTVLRWLADAQHAGFATKHARARELQGDLMDERILEVAETVTNETASAARVKIEAYKWRASKLAPKRYGDRIDVVSSDQSAHPAGLSFFYGHGDASRTGGDNG